MSAVARNVASSRRGTIALRMVAMFLAVLTVPVALIMAVMMSAFREANAKELLRSQQYSMNQVVDNFENYFAQIDQTTQDVIFAEATQQTLEGTTLSQTMRFQLDSMIHKKGYQEGACVAYVDNQNRVYKTDNVKRLGAYLVENLPGSGLIRVMQADYARLRWSLEPTSLFDSSLNAPAPYSLFVGRWVRHLDMAVAPGYLILEVPNKKLRALMSDPLMYTDTRYMLLTGDGRVVLDSANILNPGDAIADDELRGRLLSASDADAFQAGGRQYVVGALSESALRLVSCLPLDIGEIRNEMSELLIKVALLGALFAVLLAVAFSRYFTRPLIEMVHAMRRMRGGDLTVQVVPRHRDELGELSETFNIMVNDTRHLVEQIHKDQRALKNSEINALIYQINPHFLYNTLDNVNALARRQPDGRISLFITELSNLLRITLSGGREVISVADELSHVESYLKIMRLRGGEAFDYAIHFEGDVRAARVIKLILQPLAENAITHGLQYREEEGRIEVAANVTDQWIELTVSDNGDGMDPPQVEALMEKLRAAVERQPSGNRGVGLTNVYRRLRLYYGEDRAHLSFERASVGGLCVRIRVPRES